jgi:hypothetical protein
MKVNISSADSTSMRLTCMVVSLDRRQESRDERTFVVTLVCHSQFACLVLSFSFAFISASCSLVRIVVKQLRGKRTYETGGVGTWREKEREKAGFKKLDSFLSFLFGLLPCS